MGWLWQGLITNWLSALVILAAGVLLAVVKKKWSNWAPLITYGLAGCALVALILFAFAGLTTFSQRPSTPITPDNVETNARAWLDNFSLTVTKMPDDDSYFLLRINLPNGDPVFVLRSKKFAQYLTFAADLTLAPEHQVMLSKMSKDQQAQLTQELLLEMSRAKINFSYVGFPVSRVHVEKRLPITSTVTEDQFMDYLDETDNALDVAKAAIVLYLERSRPLTIP